MYNERRRYNGTSSPTGWEHTQNDSCVCHHRSTWYHHTDTNTLVVTSCTRLSEKQIPVRSEHDDVIKWKHFPRYWPFVRGIHRSSVNSPHKGQWRGALMFSLICVWINGWVNNREAGDLRRYRAHYDVSVMNRRRHSIDYLFVLVLHFRCHHLTYPYWHHNMEKIFTVLTLWERNQSAGDM